MKTQLTRTEESLLDEAQGKGTLGKALIYTKLSGPGWLQGAITLGGGSLMGALYVGVISGYHLLWLQPLAMLLGVVMLSAIGYVTLSTGERPFDSVNRNISPALGWAWVIATLMANIVWAMPQFSLGIGAIQQNILPVIGSGVGSTIGVGMVFLLSGLAINHLYQSGSKGVKLFEMILQAMVGLIVIAFFLVVGVLTFSGSLSWSEVFAGLIPRTADLFTPAEEFLAPLAATGAHEDFWRKTIVDNQRDIIITAFGSAVGINMTFLLPYTMLRRKWGKKHRGLAIFDLSIGLIVPFVLATSCIVIAAAAAFHTRTADILDASGKPFPSAAGSYYMAFAGHPEVVPLAKKHDSAEAKMAAVAAHRASIDRLPEPERKIGAMLSKRNNIQLAKTLNPLTGPTIAQKVFGFGVLGMAVSTIIVLMLMNGFAFRAMFGKPDSQGIHMLGCAVSGLGGFVGAFIWSNPDARAALAVPTSVIGASMIPIAYFTFFLMMNSRRVLGESMPAGRRRVLWNSLMGFSTVIATCGSLWALSHKGTVGMLGITALAALFIVGLIGFFRKNAANV